MGSMFCAFVHHLVAHPLIALSLGARWANRFHDWTADLAWGPGTEEGR